MNNSHTFKFHCFPDGLVDEIEKIAKAGTRAELGKKFQPMTEILKAFPGNNII